MRNGLVFFLGMMICMCSYAQQNGMHDDLLNYLPGQLLDYEAQTSVSGETLEEDGSVVEKAERIYEYETRILQVSIVRYRDAFLYESKSQVVDLGTQEAFEVHGWRAGLNYIEAEKKAELTIAVKQKYLVILSIAEVNDGKELKKLAEELQVNRLP